MVGLQIRCPGSKGSRDDAASGRQSICPVSSSGQERQRPQVPPNQAKQPSPRHAESEVGSLTSEQQPIAHANERTDQQMDQQTAHSREARIETSNLGRTPVARRTGLGNDAANQAGKTSPFERSNRSETGSRRFTVKRIGVDKQAQPQAIESRVGDTQQQSIARMCPTSDPNRLLPRSADQSSGKPAANGESVSGPRNHQNIPKPKPQAIEGAMAAYVALKEHSEHGPDQ